jgi:hypothetical protein
MIRLSHLCQISISLIKKVGKKRYLKIDSSDSGTKNRGKWPGTGISTGILNQHHNIIQQFGVDNHKTCIGCWLPDPGNYHLTHGCPVLAAKNWVVRYHRETAQTILYEHCERLASSVTAGVVAMVVKRVVEVAKMVVRVAIKALAPAPSGEDATDTGSEQSANRASASRFAAGGSNQNYDVFEDIDSEEYHLQSSLAPDKGCEGKKCCRRSCLRSVFMLN